MDAVRVGRMTVSCELARDHRNPSAVQARLGDVAAGPLPEALAELLRPLARLGDEVIILPRLELSFELDMSGDLADVARRWAARLAAALAAYLDPAARTTLARFPDEAHYLGRFLTDAVAGRAGAWYYRRYRGLTALPVPAIVRTAVLEEPSRGLAALAALAPSDRQAVLAALGAPEARRIVETLAAGAVADDLDAVAAVLAPRVPAWRSHAPALPSPWQAGLLLLVLVVEALTPGELPAAAKLAAALAAFHAGRAQRRSRAAQIAATLDGAGLPDPSPLLAVSPARREALLAPLGAAGSRVEPPPEAWYTRFGGLLLLLPRIAELPQIYPCEADRARLRLLILSRTAGARRAADVLADPVLRRIAGVAGVDGDLDDWLVEEAPRIAALLPAALWQRAFARADVIHLEVARHRPWGPLQIAVSEPDGDWLGLAPLQRALWRGPAWDNVRARPSLPRAHALGRVLEHVVAGDSPAEPALALAAQQVLRAFARRLPGFADSSPRHLHDNFLDFDATVVESAGTFHCRVGRPRLAVVLGLTGALRGRIPLGFDDLWLELYPGG